MLKSDNRIPFTVFIEGIKNLQQLHNSYLYAFKQIFNKPVFYL
jgi:hypothetical protein